MEGKDSCLNSKTYPDSFGRFIGTSHAMQEIYGIIEKAAASQSPVFITGQSGTGKEICAEALHFYSDRKNQPFIAVNCAALPNDLVESALFGHVKGAFTGAQTNRQGAIAQAQNGTLFLDEICNMPLDIQAKLLRFTQKHTYRQLGSDKVHKANIRIISATNCDPIGQIQTKLFREDLYYRLHVIAINMPPLRARGDDIIDIAHHYLHNYSKQENKNFTGFTDNVKNFIYNHEWPGNIRELQNMLKQIVTLHDGQMVTTFMLPDFVCQNTLHTQHEMKNNSFNHISLPLWQIEKRAIEKAIQICGGNITKAAAILAVSPSTLYRKKQSWEEK